MKLYIKLTEENNFLYVIEGNNLSIREEHGNPIFWVVDTDSEDKTVRKFGFHVDKLIYYKFE